MGPHHHDRSGPNDPLPRAAWIGAYLDGELGPDELARVEAWLTDSAAARAEVEAQRRLRDHFAAGPVPDPSPATWDQALAGIKAGLRAAGSRANPRRHDLWIACVAAAAAVVAGVWLSAVYHSGKRSEPVVEAFAVAAEDDVVIDDMDPADAALLVLGRVPGHLPQDLLAQAPLEVADESEIAVITMEGDDTGMLVVGVPPITGLFEPALPGEVRVDHIATAQDGPRPYMHEQTGGMPMIMMRQKTVRRD